MIRGLLVVLQVDVHVMKIDPDDLVDLSEAARIRGVSHQAIMQLVAKGRFKIVKISGRTFLFRCEVENFTPEKSGPKTIGKAKAKARRKK